MLEQYNLKQKVNFVGVVEQDDVHLNMTVSDVFLSLYDLFNEGNHLLEAMTQGNDIISFEVSDKNRIIENGTNGVLLEMCNLDNLGQIMPELTNDKENRLLLGYFVAKYIKDHIYCRDERTTAEEKIDDSALQTYIRETNEFICLLYDGVELYRYGTEVV